MPEPYYSATLAWVLTYLFHSTLLLCAAVVAARLLPTTAHRLRDGVWKVALVGGFVTATVQLTFGLTPEAVRVALARPAEAVVETEVEKTTSPAPATASVPRVRRPSPRARRRTTPRLDPPARDYSAASLPAPLATVASNAPAPPSANRSSEPPTRHWVPALWALLLSIGALRSVRGHLQLRRLLAGRRSLSHGPEGAWLEQLAQAARLRRAPRLSTIDALRSPISFGCLRPEICVPTRAQAELGPSEWKALLAHEVAHIKRRDPVWLELCRWIEALLVIQPLNRLARRGIEREAEFLCDAWAVRWTGAPFGLARCLTRVADWIIGEPTTLPAALPVTRMAASGSQLGARVEHLLSSVHSKPDVRRSGVFAAVALALLGGLALAAPGVVPTAGDETDAAASPSPPNSPLVRIERRAVRPPQPETSADNAVLREAPGVPSGNSASLELVRVALEALDHQTAELSNEIDALLSQGAQLPATAALRERLASVRARVERLGIRRQQLDALLRELARRP